MTCLILWDMHAAVDNLRRFLAHSSCEHDSESEAEGMKMRTDAKDAQAEMIRILAASAAAEGYSPSRLAGVQYLKLSHPLPRHPVIYSPSIVIVAQGTKVGYLGDEVYTYGPDDYLVLSVPLPFECETPDATPETPLLALSIGVDQGILGELILEMSDYPLQAETPRGLHTSRATPEMKDAALRLLCALDDPLQSQILGRQIVREITFRVLMDEQGWALRALAGLNGGFNQVSKALNLIHRNYSTALDVESLAKAASMSVSGFHQTFKTVTATSPVQYIKSLRLHKARMLMVQDGLNAGLAATRVGYASLSQFSREFKRFFGSTPTAEAQKLRAVGLPELPMFPGIGKAG